MRTAPTEDEGRRTGARAGATAAEALLAAGAGYLATQGAGLVLVDPHGRVLRSEGAAAELLQAMGIPQAEGTVLAMLPRGWLGQPDGRALCLPANQGGGVEVERLASPTDGAGERVLLLRRRRAAGDTIDCLRGAGLTPRQAETLLLLGDGLGNKAIARRLGISPGTVKKHLEAIYAALAVDGRTAAVAALKRMA